MTKIDGETALPAFWRLRLSHWILLLVAVLLAWDLYPYVQWSTSRGKIYKAVGKTWPDVEAEFLHAGLKGRVRDFESKTLDVYPVRLSLMARACFEAAIVYNRDNDYIALKRVLFPSALIELDTSNTLIQITYMD